MFYGHKMRSDNRIHTDWGLDVGLPKNRELVLQVMATGVDNILIDQQMLRYPNSRINPVEDLPSISALSHPTLQVGT